MAKKKSPSKVAKDNLIARVKKAIDAHNPRNAQRLKDFAAVYFHKTPGRELARTDDENLYQHVVDAYEFFSKCTPGNRPCIEVSNKDYTHNSVLHQVVPDQPFLLDTA